MDDNTPQWFVDLFLDVYGELRDEKKRDRFKKAGSATFVAEASEDEHIKGYALVNNLDEKEFIFIGKRTEFDEQEHTEYLKYFSCLPKNQ